MLRTFIAIAIPAPVAEMLETLADSLPVARPVPAENMHLTLAFLGNVDRPELEELHAELERLRTPGFDLTVEGLGLFGGARPRVVWAGLVPEPGLMRLQRKVANAARRAGLELPARRFVPHVTLARLREGEVEPARIERAVAANGSWKAGPFPVRDFRLMNSVTTSRGPHYEELARYHLGPPVPG